MASTSMLSSSSSFRIRRPLVTTNGFVSDVDLTIKQHLDELDTILGYAVFSSIEDSRQPDPNEGIAAKPKAAISPTISSATNGMVFPLVTALKKPLTPKTTTSDHWDNNGILSDLVNQAKNSGQKYLTISDCIDKTNTLSNLKYELQDVLVENWNLLDFNKKTVLQYKNILDYLIAYAFFVKEISDVNALSNFIKSHKLGSNNIVNYGIISAARAFIQKESLNIDEFNDPVTKKDLTYNDMEHPLIQKLSTSGLSMSSASFKKEIQKIIDDYIFNGAELKMIEGAGIGFIPAELKPLLVKYIRSSPVKITSDNIKYFLPLFISKINGSVLPVTDELEETTVEESDKDFDVDFFEDDRSMIQVSISNVKCAAQLYYGMVVGEELDVFNVVNFFTHKYLVRGGIEIQDQQLRENLQLYVFSNKFTDLKTNRVLDRTQAGERQMFYRQVFNYGTAEITEDIIANKEFPRLWKMLIYESAKYLEKAQASLNPDSYVSRQNVMQAVEDLQYNLSTNCTGMANVITPIIYAELNFVIQKIFMHPEVLRQVVPVGSTWWRVVETLYTAMKQSRPKATVLYNKAKLGQQIIKAIAEYNPASFEDDKTFSSFISLVDANITTQSILQDSLLDDLKAADSEEEEEETDETNTPSMMQPSVEPKMPSAAVNGDSKDEWDF